MTGSQWRGRARGRKRRILLPVGTLVVAGGLAYAFATAGSVVSAPAESGALHPTAKLTEVANTGPQLIDYRVIDARIQQLMTDPDMVGLGVAIIENGRIRFVKGYGVTQAGGSDQVNGETVFRWASLSKGVAGTLVAKLAERGRLSLDAPVADFATSLRLPGGGEGRINVRDLLSHRVGLVHNAYDDRLEGGQNPQVIRASLGLLAPYCPPATCYSYQNIAFDAASEVVQHVTGRAYGDVARALLFGPLGMADTSVGRAGLEGARSWARPHRRGGHPGVLKDAYYLVPAAGGVNSSAFDLGRWMQAQMGGMPGVLSPALLDRVHAPQVATPPRGGRRAVDRALSASGYGLGWRDYNYSGRRQIGHRGAVEGYRSLILFDPDAKAGVAMLWNSHSEKPVGLQLEVMDMVYRLPRHEWMELKPPAGQVAAAQPGRTS